jgi:hypothetical protein
MAEITVVEDLQALLNLEPGEGETQHEFAKRLAEKGFAVTEEDWETLSESTQSWINDTVTAVSEKKPISELTLPSGIDVVIPAEPSSDPETGEITEAPAPVKRAAKKKSDVKALTKVVYARSFAKSSNTGADDNEDSNKVKKAKVRKGSDNKVPRKAKASGEVRKGSKTEIVAKLLQRNAGCTSKQVLEATGWPAISMPAISRACGLKLVKEKKKGEVTRYWGK